MMVFHVRNEGHFGKMCQFFSCPRFKLTHDHKKLSLPDSSATDAAMTAIVK
jgi:hypothetical protein